MNMGVQVGKYAIKFSMVYTSKNELAERFLLASGMLYVLWRLKL